MLSVIIAARNEKYLERTIRDVLANARGDIEVVVVLDGWLPEPQIHIGDDRVIFHHMPESIGQRAAINYGAKQARGEYIMKLDAHCAVSEGFDVGLIADHQPDWTVVPRMYNLDTETWKPKLHKRTDYMYFSSPTAEQPFRAQYYKNQPDNANLIDDIMCCMGPGWFLTKERYWALGGLDEGHGGWGQMGIEIALKAWLSGGALKVNKKVWFAHWFRGSDGGFPYAISNSDVERARTYSQQLWLHNKWPLAKRPLSWVIEKFQPEEWDEYMPDGWRRFYNHVLKQSTGGILWRGIRVIKLPTDLILYSEIIWDKKPDIIVENGTGFGGSALWFADCLNTIGSGRVITVDIRSDRGHPEHPRIKYITGRSTSTDVLSAIRAEIDRYGAELGRKPTVMVILDGDHSRSNVKRQLVAYGPMVTSGQYMVVEDIYRRDGVTPDPQGPGPAVDWFLRVGQGRGFKREPIDKRFLYCISRGGWLKKI